VSTNCRHLFILNLESSTWVRLITERWWCYEQLWKSNAHHCYIVSSSIHSYFYFKI